MHTFVGKSCDGLHMYVFMADESASATKNINDNTTRMLSRDSRPRM